MTTRPHHSVAALAAFCAMAASAQELAILGGGTWTDEPHERTHGWMVEYLHPLDGPWAASFAYQNEGHVPGHHRDGHAVQLWLRTPPARGWSLAAGFGPYYSFDTALAESPGEHQDAHGWGAITTVAIGWRDGASLWSWQVRVNHVETRNGPDSTMLLVGVGRHLEQDATFGVRAAGRREELSLATGQTIVNSFESQGARARAIEYRHDFGGVLRGSVAWISEGDARLIRRNGVAAQAWVEPTFDDRTYSLGLGIGPYVAIDDYRSEGHRTLGLVSTTFSRRFGHAWNARITWHRTATRYDRDSDIVLLGMGYRF